MKAVQVESEASIRSRPFPGVTRAEDRVNLSFRVSGPLIELSVDIGNAVETDQVLAKIDPRDFEVAVNEAKGQLERSIAARDFAISDFERAERIQQRDPGAISQSMVDRKREEANKLRAEVRSLEAQLDAAKDKLQYTDLRAPFPGVVVAKFVDNFEFVRAKQPVLRMLDTSNVEMVVDIPEHLIRYIDQLEKVVITLDVLPGKKFSAKVKEIGTEANAVTRTFPVTLVMDQPKDVAIFAGMSGEARFIKKGKNSKTKAQSITIPVQALLTGDAGKSSFVWVINPKTGIVEKRKITIEKLTNKGVEVSSGLKPREWIATAGVNFLEEGQKVRILQNSELE